MSELHKFLFDGLPVRGAIVRLTDAWQEVLSRRASGVSANAYPKAVVELLGEMSAAALLMQSNIKFNGSVVLQIMGDGPVKLAVAETQADLSFRATAKVVGEVDQLASFPELVNRTNSGRCAISLRPKDRIPGQQPYQGIVPLSADDNIPLGRLGDALQHYMLQSEQLETTFVLAADDRVAAGLIIQRVPVDGDRNLKTASGRIGSPDEKDDLDWHEDYNRITTLASSLKREELLALDIETILRRLFWEEKLSRFVPSHGLAVPRFACTCSRDRVAGMIRGLGEAEASSIVAERGDIEVGCEFCGLQYTFDAVEAALIFHPSSGTEPTNVTIQ